MAITGQLVSAACGTPVKLLSITLFLSGAEQVVVSKDKEGTARGTSFNPVLN